MNEDLAPLETVIALAAVAVLFLIAATRQGWWKPFFQWLGFGEKR
ncbi:hypothetical protein [Leucobacter allii]|nr:hypothetical protein [Leucobacter allii]